MKLLLILLCSFLTTSAFYFKEIGTLLITVPDTNLAHITHVKVCMQHLKEHLAELEFIQLVECDRCEYCKGDK